MKRDSKENIEDISNEPSKPYIFNSTYRLILYLVLLSTEIALNISSGLISSSSKAIKSAFLLNDKEFGFIASANAIGRGIGSILFTLLINYINRKNIFLFFVLMKSITLYCIQYSKTLKSIAFIRCITGIAHMPPSIYVPLWIDNYGFSKYKTIQLLGTQVASPIGKTIGYVLHIIYGDKYYYKGFGVAGIYFFMIFVFILFAPNYYFSTSISRSKKIEEKKKLVEDERQSIASIFSLKKEKPENKDSFFNKILIIITNKKWLLVNWSVCVINGVLSTTHYWCSDYMRNALNINDSKSIILSYSTVCLLSPLVSMLITSIFNKLFGGYESKNGPIISVFISIFTFIFGIGSTFLNELSSFLITLIMFFAFGSSLLSMSIGLILVCIDEKLKEQAFSITTIINMFVTGNIFPLFYGIINDYFISSDNKRMGMRFTLSLPGISIICLILLNIILKKEEENKEEDSLLEKENNNI